VATFGRVVLGLSLAAAVTIGQIFGRLWVGNVRRTTVPTTWMTEVSVILTLAASVPHLV
jgi:hypothetical protein